MEIDIENDFELCPWEREMPSEKSINCNPIKECHQIYSKMRNKIYTSKSKIKPAKIILSDKKIGCKNPKTSKYICMEGKQNMSILNEGKSIFHRMRTEPSKNQQIILEARKVDNTRPSMRMSKETVYIHQQLPRKVHHRAHSNLTEMEQKIWSKVIQSVREPKIKMLPRISPSNTYKP